MPSSNKSDGGESRVIGRDASDFRARDKVQKLNDASHNVSHNVPHAPTQPSMHVQMQQGVLSIATDRMGKKRKHLRARHGIMV